MDELQQLIEWMDKTKIGYGEHWVNSVAMHCAIRDKILDLMGDKGDRSPYYDDMLHIFEVIEADKDTRSTCNDCKGRFDEMLYGAGLCEKCYFIRWPATKTFTTFQRSFTS